MVAEEDVKECRNADYAARSKKLHLNIREQDEKRRVRAASLLFQYLESNFFAGEKTQNDAQAYKNLTGSMLSYCFLHDAGVYYYQNAGKEKFFSRSGGNESDAWRQAVKLAEILHIDETYAYIHWMEALVYEEAQKNPNGGELAKLLGAPDNTWAYYAVNGMVRQLALFEFHYFEETEKKALGEAFGQHADALEYVFSEETEWEEDRNILAFCRLEEQYEKERYENYNRELLALRKEIFLPLKSKFDADQIKHEWDDSCQRLMIGEADAPKALKICQEMHKKGSVKQVSDGIRLYQAGTFWKEHFDAKEEEAYLEITWNRAKKAVKVPYLAKFSGQAYAFDEEPKSAEGAKRAGIMKRALRAIGRRWKTHAAEKSEKSPKYKEARRRLNEWKKSFAYKIKYKYRYEVNDKLILFESYHGDRYNCNPRGIYEAILQDERYLDYKFIWAFKEPQKYKFLEEELRTKVVKTNSSRYYINCAKAKYIVMNLLLNSHITLKKEQEYIQTWHGKPIKAIGCARQFETDPRRTLASTVRHYTKNAKKITKLLSPSAFFTPVMRDAFNMQKLGKENCIVETGYARNDELFRYTDAQKARICQRLGVDPSKKVILYAPTWRELFGKYLDSQKMDVALRVSDSIDFKKMREKLGDGYILLFRAHHMDAKAMDISRYKDFIIDVTGYENVNDLYIISDLLISDYSGTIFDFGILKRPMVYYMFDRELYTSKLQGVNIDLDELPGIIVKKEEELVPAILKQFREFQYDEKYERFMRKYNQYEDGRAGQRVIEKCLPDTVTKKTFTVQRFIKDFKKGTLYHETRRLKLNILGILREKGVIKDKNTKKLLALKNKYAGRKCYLVGNGPSLTPEDLDLIKDEISFGCNMIYKIFDKTKWRPAYHFIVDVVYSGNLYLEIKNNIQAPLITNSLAYENMKQKPKNITYVTLFSQEDYQIRGNMMAYYISARATVMTFMIEMAMFMGMKEIYLLGTDCTNSFTAGHFGEAYTATTLDMINLARARRIIGKPDMTLEEYGEYRRERSIIAYEKIAKYAKDHGVKIYNATRGGALEVFERVRLEDTLK